MEFRLCLKSGIVLVKSGGMLFYLVSPKKRKDHNYFIVQNVNILFNSCKWTQKEYSKTVEPSFFIKKKYCVNAQRLFEY